MADEYRENADDCREQAAKVLSPLDKERWLKLAESWLKLPKNVEESKPTG